MRIRNLKILGIFAALVSLLAAVSATAAADGGLRPELIDGLRQSLKMDPATQALFNALSGGDARKLAVNRTILQSHEAVFNHTIKIKGITDQKRSGRCWLFAALNVARPAIIEKYKLDDFEFSVNYLAFWDKLEKANFFLETVIELRDSEPLDRELEYFTKDPINDGGWWNYVVALVDKYGALPKEAMQETFSSENTDVMNDVLATKLRIFAAQLRRMAAEKKSVDELRAAKEKMLPEIYRILAMNYGVPPTEFTYRLVDKDGKPGEPKKYTPQSFYKEWAGVDLTQYVQLCDDPTQPYGKHYRLRRVRNIVGAADVDYVNAPIATLKSIAVKSIVDGHPVCFSGDAKKDMDRDNGIMQVGLFDFASIYGVDLSLGKAERLLMREGQANHAMSFVGVDIQNDKPVKFQVENSWGKERGKGGFWTMYDPWFDAHVYSIIVKKAYVPDEVLRTFQEPAVELPPWAPMNTFMQSTAKE
jgi:bleomycin hydrolase